MSPRRISEAALSLRKGQKGGNFRESRPVAEIADYLDRRMRNQAGTVSLHFDGTGKVARIEYFSGENVADLPRSNE